MIGGKCSPEYAMGLTDAGLITGAGYYDDGPSGLSDGNRVFVLEARSLIAVPEPSGIALLTLAILALVRRRWSGYTGRELHQ